MTGPSSTEPSLTEPTLPEPGPPGPPLTGPTLTVVMVSYNTREATCRAVESALRQTHWARADVIVVDNGSKDGSADASEALGGAVAVDRAGENLGFARAVNRGVRAAAGEYVVLLNPDTVVLDGALDELVRFAVANPAHGIYGGRTIRSDGSLDPSSCWGAPSLWSLLCFATLLSTAAKGSPVFDPESLGAWRRDSVREVPIVTGCLLLMRRDVFLALGGMDERFFLYGEDAEFSLRAAAHGYRPVLVPTAQIVHDSGGSATGSGSKMCMVSAGKVTMLRAAWKPAKARAGVALLLAGVAVRALLEQVSRRQRRMWSEVWSRRGDWLGGYPAAERTLFGRLPAAAAISESG